MIAHAVSAPPRADVARWGGSDAKIATELAEVRERLGRIELALLALVEREAERQDEGRAIDRQPAESYTSSAVAEELGIDRKEVNRLCQLGRIRAVKLDKGSRGVWSIPRAELDRLRSDGAPDLRGR